MASVHNIRDPYLRDRHLHDRSIGEVIAELRDELKEFINTRVQMLRSEMNEKVGAVKAAVPALVIAAVMALSAWFVLTWALIYLLSMAFGQGHGSLALAAAIVGVVYLLVGGVAGAYGYKTLTAKSLAPERTLRVLKQDQVWAQTEAKTQL